MRIFNSDGSEARICGNGLRCAAALAFDNFFCRKAVMHVQTGAGVRVVEVLSAGETRSVRVDMGPARLTAREVPTTIAPSTEVALRSKIQVSDRGFEVTCISIGNPHAVIFCEEPVSDDFLRRYGPELERHVAFPRGANIHFVSALFDDAVRVRTWELGSGYTKACGSGACAAAVAWSLGHPDVPARLRTVLDGGELMIEWGGGGDPVFMEGPAAYAFTGEWPSVTLGSLPADARVPECYRPPAWWPSDKTRPTHRMRLANLPTPLQRWMVPSAPSDVDIWIKRDDFTGLEVSGNKVRKLEFLLAEALNGGYDSVATLGALQSNHCRATAAAARQVGLEPFLILKCQDPEDGIGIDGNVFFDRAMGAQIKLVSKARAEQVGDAALLEELCQESGRKMFTFASGGSTALGAWGYIEQVQETLGQAGSMGLDLVYFTCGSGGTAAGLALGLELSGARADGVELVGLCVDDSPRHFYDKLRRIFDELGVGHLRPEDLLRLEQCTNLGYGVASEGEINFIARTARATGVLLDPVYSGKGALGMLEDLRLVAAAGLNPRHVLFVHTGGAFGAMAQAEAFKIAFSE